jgi:hypothetical protein
MKRLALTLVAGAFGTLMMLPTAHAQAVQDLNNDAGTVPGDRTYNQASEQTVEDYQNGVGGTATHEQVDVQKRSSDVQNGALGSTTEKQVDIQKRSADVQNDGLGSTTTEKQVDIQKRSDAENGDLGTVTHQQVDIQKRTDDLRVNNNGVNDSTADRFGDDNQ